MEYVKSLKETGRPETNVSLRGLSVERNLSAAVPVQQRAPVSPRTSSTTSSGSQMLTIGEVALILRLHPTTVYRLAKKGALPAFKIGSSWRFDLEDLNRWRGEQYRANAR